MSMLRHKHPSIASNLLLWIAMTLLGVGVAMGILTYWVSAVPLENQLKARGISLLTTLSVGLKPYLWELDAVGMRTYIAEHPPPHDLVAMRVTTQFGDPVFETRFADTTDVLVQQREITHRGACIGHVKIELGRERLRLAKRTIAFSVATIVVFGISAIILVTTVLMRGIMRRPIRILIEDIGMLAKGNYERRLPPMKHAELNAIAMEINAMAEKIARRTRALKTEIADRRKAQADLQHLKDHLEELVGRRTHDLMRTIEQLNAEVRERRQAQDEILVISDRERQRIGGDLHDTLGQQLAGVAFLAGSLKKILNARGAPESEAVGQITELLREAIDQARGIAKGLAPVSLLREGLAFALRQLSSDTTSLYGIRCRLDAPETLDITDTTVSTHLYRITQEAIHNAIRHGQATEIIVTLSCADGRGALSITDNGSGMGKPGAATHGMGLRIMRYRAEAVGGRLEVASADGKGTRVTASFCVPPRTASPSE